MQPNAPFDPEAARALLESPAGRALLRLLQQDGGAALRQAADALRSGDTAQAQRIVAPLMRSEQAQKLAEQLDQTEKKRNGGV